MIASLRLENVFYPDYQLVSHKPTIFQTLYHFNYTATPQQFPAKFQPIVVPMLRTFNLEHLKQIYTAQQEELDAFNNALQPHYTSYITYTNSFLFLYGYAFLLFLWHHHCCSFSRLTTCVTPSHH